VDGGRNLKANHWFGMVLKPVVNHGINYQAQLVQDFVHQQYYCKKDLEE